MPAPAHFKLRWLAIALGIAAVFIVLYVGWHALQEDVFMSSASPLRFALVDSRLRSLDLGSRMDVEGYYYTVGDGPKLPGSDVTLVGDLDPGEAMKRARAELNALGFEADPWCQRGECHFSRGDEPASVTIDSKNGRTCVRVFIGNR